jgi:hypothetical protein
MTGRHDMKELLYNKTRSERRFWVGKLPVATVEVDLRYFWRLIYTRASAVTGVGKIKKVSGVLQFDIWEDNSEGDLFFT